MSFIKTDVKSCCGCFSLETGVKLIGFSHAILSGAAIILLVAEEIDYFFSILRNAKGTLSFVLFSDVGVSLHFIFAIFLLQGIYNRKSYYLMAWILLAITSIIVGIFMLIIIAFTILGFGAPHNIKSIQLDFGRLLSGVIFTMITCYTIIVVHSYYIAMKTLEGVRTT